MKRFSSHYIITTNLEYLKQHVIELNDSGEVINIFPLTEELESIEWLPGAIELKNIDNRIIAFHYFPYNFTLMKPVDETLRRQLL